MKKTKLRSRTNKKTLLKKAHKACWKACYEAIKRRDKVCQVHPNCTEKVLQADHFVSRKHLNTFYDERNLLLVCSVANWQKFIGRGNVAYLIGKRVEEKWGFETIEELGRNARIPKKWSIEELEHLTKQFEEMYLGDT